MTTIFLTVLLIYLLPGFIYAVAFLLKGIIIHDDAAKSAGIAFRLIILPGIVLLWPFLTHKWQLKRNQL